MARGKTVSKATIVNNQPKVTVTKTLEQIVVNDQLVPEDREVNPGVNTLTM